MKYKTYIIEDKEFTSPEIVKILNCSASTARARLTRSKTINELLSPINSNKGKDRRIVKPPKDKFDMQIRKILLGAW